ncbi:MAG TPA: hypothetical protein VJR92_13235 [Gemmatimonadaceae bacterium]|nr:hypothetical protein [Gemmatimonadaceae bacterium]
MPTDKDFKRLVRARMKKSGESYTAARAQLVAKRAPEKKIDYAKLAGISDEAIKKNTGCGWEKWVYVLDKAGAAGMKHRDVANLVHTKWKVPDWWTQTVTVGYERIKGKRAIGQRMDGTYEATKSKTFAVSATTLFRAWKNNATRKRWMDGAGESLRSSTAPKALRFAWSDGSVVVIGITSKGIGKSSVAVQHGKLPSRDSADRLKKYWSDRLEALGQILQSN